MIRLSTFRHAFDRDPVAKACSLAGLARALSRFPVLAYADKAARNRIVPLWSPAVYPGGATRAASAVESVTCLVLDYDDGTPIEEALRPWRAFACAWHTSGSHAPEAPRFRVVLPLLEPVAGRDWHRAWRWAAEQCVGEPDRACKDPSRLYFVPHRRAEDSPVGWGVAFDAPLLRMRLADPPKRLAAAPVRAGTMRELTELLKASPGAREKAALKAGAAVLGAGPSRRAKGAPCPQCGRRSVWWPIEPERWGGAGCDHRNSCGWTGWLDQVPGVVNG